MLQTCEKTGLQFDARSTRQKNHPAIMSIVNESSRDGWYTQCLNALKAGREAGFSTLEEFVELLNETRQAAREQRNMQITEYMNRKRANAEAKRQRAITNNLLRSHGYTWNRFENDEEDQDFYGAPAVEYTLKCPDGRSVSVKQAMIELAQQNVKAAREWCEEHGVEIPQFVQPERNR